MSEVMTLLLLKVPSTVCQPPPQHTLDLVTPGIGTTFAPLLCPPPPLLCCVATMVITVLLHNALPAGMEASL